MPTYILQAVISILEVVERDSWLLVPWIDFSYKESSFELNGVYLNGEVGEMLEGKNYRAVEMLIPVACGFIDWLTGYRQSLNMTKMHAMYNSMVSRAMSSNWRRGLARRNIQDVWIASIWVWIEGSGTVFVCAYQEYRRWGAHCWITWWRISGGLMLYQFLVPLCMNYSTLISNGNTKGIVGGEKYANMT